MENKKYYDIIIVGAGPAGLTAGIYALRSGKTVLVLEKNSIGGQMSFSPRIENYPGVKTISGNELADNMTEQFLNLGGELELSEVISINDSIKKEIIADNDTYMCSAVILANGVKHRTLGIPGESELIGNGISFCAVCDGAFYQNKHVVVIGGGNSAIQEAILLSDNCSKVTIIQNLSKLTCEKSLERSLLNKTNISLLYNTVIDSFLTQDGALNGVVVKSTTTDKTEALYCDGLFIAIGLVPANNSFSQLAELDEWGYYLSDENCMTKTRGVFVAGDCRRKNIRQVTTAISDGSIAAISACKYIDTYIEK